MPRLIITAAIAGLIATSLLAASLPSQSAEAHAQGVVPGMTRRDVMELYGRPDRVDYDQGYTFWIWYQPYRRVTLHDGAVVFSYR